MCRVAGGARGWVDIPGMCQPNGRLIFYPLLINNLLAYLLLTYILGNCKLIFALMHTCLCAALISYWFSHPCRCQGMVDLSGGVWTGGCGALLPKRARGTGRLQLGV